MSQGFEWGLNEDWMSQGFKRGLFEWVKILNEF